MRQLFSCGMLEMILYQQINTLKLLRTVLLSFYKLWIIKKCFLPVLVWVNLSALFSLTGENRRENKRFYVGGLQQESSHGAGYKFRNTSGWCWVSEWCGYLSHGYYSDESPCHFEAAGPLSIPHSSHSLWNVKTTPISNTHPLKRVYKE